MKKSTFDNIISQNLLSQVGPDSFGYHIAETNTTYPFYFTPEAFDHFVKDMNMNYPSAHEAYSRGKGSELKQAAGGKHPPKMASVASSSRFCYLALRDGAQAFGSSAPVFFEKECRINGISGTAPQLDACIPSENIFFEVKCHEIFDPHTIELRNVYWNHIYGPGNDFGFSPQENPGSQSFHIPLGQFGITGERTMFDIKQLLCHLLGIRSTEKHPATLIYLFFKPISDTPEVQAELDELFRKLSEEIHAIFHSAPIRYFCQKNQIDLRAVAECAYVMESAADTNIINLV